MLSQQASYVKNATCFQEQSLVERYHLRPAYPAETFEILNSFIKDDSRSVLDIGCGTGNISRPFAEYVERIDAVDFSQRMLDRAQELPGGASPKIRWLHGRAEEIETQSPYGLITAGESLHWMDWAAILPRLARILSPQGVLAIVRIGDHPAWHDGYYEVAKPVSKNPRHVPVDMITILEDNGLFQKLGGCKTAPVEIQQTVEDYISAQHGRSSLALESMTAADAERFDADMRKMLQPYAQDGLLSFSVVGEITRGKPLKGN